MIGLPSFAVAVVAQGGRRAVLSFVVAAGDVVEHGGTFFEMALGQPFARCDSGAPAASPAPGRGRSRRHLPVAVAGPVWSDATSGWWPVSSRDRVSARRSGPRPGRAGGSVWPPAGARSRVGAGRPAPPRRGREAESDRRGRLGRRGRSTRRPASGGAGGWYRFCPCSGVL